MRTEIVVEMIKNKGCFVDDMRVVMAVTAAVMGDEQQHDCLLIGGLEFCFRRHEN